MQISGYTNLQYVPLSAVKYAGVQMRRLKDLNQLRLPTHD
jgi:hypothetical protein